jgi:diguanylate cyclase (GGDEF)-like protein
MKKRIKAAWLAFLNPEIIETKDELDELTGALTRRSFKRLAEPELARAKRGQSLSLVYLDFDNLKEINDTKGHPEGDLYLEKFAQIIMGNIRPYDLFARWGGDEFVLLLPGVDLVVVGEIISRLYNLFPHFSWGITSLCDGDDLGSLIKRADEEIYQMKASKKK